MMNTTLPIINGVLSTTQTTIKSDFQVYSELIIVWVVMVSLTIIMLFAMKAYFNHLKEESEDADQ